MGQELNRYCSEEDTQMQQARAKMLNNTRLWEIKIIITVRYYFIPTRMAIISFSKSKITSVGEDAEIGGNVL